MKTIKNETPMDKALIHLINLCIENGGTEEEVIKFFDRSDVSRKSNYNLRKKYNEIYPKLNFKKTK